MRNLIAVMLVALIATPAFAGPKTKKEDVPAAPAEEKPAKKEKAKKEDVPAPAAPADDAAKAKKEKKKDKEAEKAKEAAPAEKKKDAPATPAPGTGSGALKPGQGVGVRGCLGSANNVNVEATSKSTVGVATCRSALEKMFVDKGLCKTKGAKVKYSWQFADTTGDYEFTCR